LPSTTDSVLNEEATAFTFDSFVEEAKAYTKREPEDGSENTLS
jgi:hypothetical protein